MVVHQLHEPNNFSPCSLNPKRLTHFTSKYSIGSGLFLIWKYYE